MFVDFFHLVFLIYANQSFDPSTNQSRESIRQGLTSVINLAFRCRSNLSYPNCTQARQTRQTCSNGYTVNLLTNLVQVASGNPAKYKVDYSVVDLCDSGRLVSPTVVRSATDVLTRDQITTIFGFQFDGAFIQSTALSASTTPPVVDQKLWLIGATLGPVAFVLLLIFFFCYLHYKCRPRQTSDKRVSFVSSLSLFSDRLARRSSILPPRANIPWRNFRRSSKKLVLNRKCAF